MEGGVFKTEDIINLKQRQIATEQLKALGNFWVGSDLTLEKKVIVPALHLTRDAKIIVNKKDLPLIDINRGAFGALNWSVRSFLAQSGIEIRFHHSTLSDDMLKDINEGKSVSVPVDIFNNTNRPIELEGEVMRFFWANDYNRLRGKDLREAMKTELTVEGDEGKDWSFGNVDFHDDMAELNEKDANRMKDVCIKLRLKQKYYIPESTDTLSIKNRRDLPLVLREIPEGLKLDFKIGETAKVKLGERILAVINTGVYGGSKRHIHSPLIDPGFEGHIRTETVYGLDYIELFLYYK